MPELMPTSNWDVDFVLLRTYRKYQAFPYTCQEKYSFIVIELTKTVSRYVDEAGKEATQRRDRLRDVLAMALATFRGDLHRVADQPSRVDTIVFRIDRTIQAISDVQRNANQATLIESWSADIARGRAVCW